MFRPESVTRVVKDANRRTIWQPGSCESVASLSSESSRMWGTWGGASGGGAGSGESRPRGKLSIFRLPDATDRKWFDLTGLGNCVVISDDETRARSGHRLRPRRHPTPPRRKMTQASVTAVKFACWHARWFDHQHRRCITALYFYSLVLCVVVDSGTLIHGQDCRVRAVRWLLHQIWTIRTTLEGQSELKIRKRVRLIKGEIDRTRRKSVDLVQI